MDIDRTLSTSYQYDKVSAKARANFLRMLKSQDQETNPRYQSRISKLQEDELIPYLHLKTTLADCYRHNPEIKSNDLLQLEWRSCARLISVLQTILRIISILSIESDAIYYNLCVLTKFIYTYDISPKQSLRVLKLQFQDLLDIAQHRYSYLHMHMVKVAKKDNVSATIPRLVVPLQLHLTVIDVPFPESFRLRFDVTSPVKTSHSETQYDEMERIQVIAADDTTATVLISSPRLSPQTPLSPQVSVTITNDCISLLENQIEANSEILQVEVNHGSPSILDSTVPSPQPIDVISPPSVETEFSVSDDQESVSDSDPLAVEDDPEIEQCEVEPNNTDQNSESVLKATRIVKFSSPESICVLEQYPTAASSSSITEVTPEFSSPSPPPERTKRQLKKGPKRGKKKKKLAPKRKSESESDTEIPELVKIESLTLETRVKKLKATSDDAETSQRPPSKKKLLKKVFSPTLRKEDVKRVVKLSKSETLKLSPVSTRTKFATYDDELSLSDDSDISAPYFDAEQSEIESTLPVDT